MLVTTIVAGNFRQWRYNRKGKNREKDYGNWLVIGHGEGIYTSYAHLANFDDKLLLELQLGKSNAGKTAIFLPS